MVADIPAPIQARPFAHRVMSLHPNGTWYRVPLTASDMECLLDAFAMDPMWQGDLAVHRSAEFWDAFNLAVAVVAR